MRSIRVVFLGKTCRAGSQTLAWMVLASLGTVVGCAGEDFPEQPAELGESTKAATYSGADEILQNESYSFCWIDSGSKSTAGATAHKAGAEASVESILNASTGLAIEIHPSCASLPANVAAVGIGWNQLTSGGSNSCRYEDCYKHTAQASDPSKTGIVLGMNATYSTDDEQTVLQELMHAFGLPHTQVDLDTDAPCFDMGDTFNVLRKGSISSEASMNGNSGFQYGSFDRDSAMSYCTSGGSHTARDIAFWRVLYGPGNGTSVDIDPLRLWYNEYTDISGQARVFSYVNVAKSKPATASSVYGVHDAARAVDADAMPSNHSTNFSTGSGHAEWLQVDIGREVEIRFVTLWNDSIWTGLLSQLRDFDIVLYADDGTTEVHRQAYPGSVKRFAHIDLGQPYVARFARVENHDDDIRYLEVAEVAVWARSDLLELRLDGDAEDQISGTHSVIGATPTGGASGQRAGALHFDGMDDYVRVAHQDRFAPTEGLTVMAWARADNWQACAAVSARIVSKTHSGGYSIRCDGYGYAPGIFASVYREGYGYVHLRAELPDHVGYGPNLVSLPVAYHHFALTYDGYSARLFVDGAQADVETFSTYAPIRYAYDNALIVGREASNVSVPEGGFAFRGAIDDVMVFGRALTRPEIEHFRGPLAAGLVGYWDFEDFDCTAGCDGTVTMSSTATVSSAPKAVDFPSGGYISVPHQAALKPEAITVSAWIYNDDWSTTCDDASETQTVLSTTHNGGYSLRCNEGDLIFMVRVGSTYYDVRTALPPDGVWVHVAATYDGETMRLYKNGDYVRKSSDPSGPIHYTYDNALIIGAEAGSGASPDGGGWVGMIDEIHVYDTDVGHDGVVWLYNQGGRAGFSTRISERR